MPQQVRSRNTDRPPNVVQLRSRIDGGRTYDEVKALDPAAAPLGTDDEAGAAPPDAAVIEETRRADTGRPEGNPLRNPRPRHHFLVGAIVGLVILAFLLTLLG